MEDSVLKSLGVTMKKVRVTIRAELEIPDEWKLVETSEGINVVDLGNGQYMDLALEPLFATDLDGVWTSARETDFVNHILDMVVAEDVTYELSVSGN